MNSPEIDQKEKISITGKINDVLKKGVPAYEVLTEIRSYQKPIVVDFNNVLVSNLTPTVINPEASSFLAELRKIGDVFIVTTAEDWNSVYKILKNGNIWSSSQILMTIPNWRFITQHEEWSPKGKELRKGYLELAKSQGRNIRERDLLKPPEYKTVAPVFNKSWEIPLIDDSDLATYKNPGMQGIHVRSFEPARTWYDNQEGTLTLSDAIQEVRKVYP